MVPHSRIAEEPLLVGHLMFTAPPKTRAASAGSTLLSLAFHAAVLALAIYVTALPGTRERAHEAISLIRISDARTVVPPPPPPPPPPMQEARPAEPVPSPTPRGFQVLQAPTITPPDIPPPSSGPVVNEADFSGVGVEGGTASGTVVQPQKTVTAENVEAAPVFTPYTVAPELRNRAAVARALVRLYPQMLRDAGVTGTALVWVLIDEHGRVTVTRLEASSGVPQLDTAALKVARTMAFSPGINHDRRVKVWVAQPLTFSLGE